MGKKSKSKGGTSHDGAVWSHEEHASRFNRKVDKQQEQENNDVEEQHDDGQNKGKRRRVLKGFHRSLHLSHDNREKRDKAKLRLHITKAERHLEKLRSR